MPIIYKTTNLINGHTYIGQSLNDDPSYKGGGKILQLSFKKYGRQNFQKEILEYCEIEDLDSREIYYIDLLKPSYNIEPGGQRKGKPRSKEVGLAISKAKKGCIPWNKGKTGIYSKESLAKMSASKKESQQGSGNSFFGKQHSQETKEKIGKNNRKQLSEELELQIIKFYKSHTSLQTQNEFNIGKKLLQRILKENNINLRKKGEKIINENN